MSRLTALALLFVLILGTACQPAPPARRETAVSTSPAPRAEPIPASPTPSVTPGPTSTPLPTATVTASPTLSPVLFPLQVPLPPDANRRISPNYRFGTDMNGQREIHHGVEFENPIGTPVLAAAEGVVRFAGSDDAAQLSPWAGFYGNAVVIEHHFPGWHTPVFTLYGHLSTIAVHTGEKVAAGDVLGEVGMSGSADGPHLHFEVRLGKNAYVYSSNPELWLVPDEGNGALAGRITTPEGLPIPGVHISLIPLDSPDAATIYLQTYVQQNALPAPDRQENFALWNLPAGQYRVEFIANGLHRQEIRIQAGVRTFFTYPVSTSP